MDEIGFAGARNHLNLEFAWAAAWGIGVSAAWLPFSARYNTPHSRFSKLLAAVREGPKLFSDGTLRGCLDNPLDVFAEQQSLLLQIAGGLCHSTHVNAMVGIPLLDRESSVADR